MKYYIIVNGQQLGPMGKDELLIRGVGRDTLVWREGMTQWMPAADVPEIADLFVEESAFGAYAQAEPQPARYYAMFGDVRVGPADVDELMNRGLQKDTPVWTQGMSDWKPAYTQPELMAALNSRTRPPQQPQQGYNGDVPPQYGNASGFYGYGQQQPQQPRNPFGTPTIHTNWMPWAIVATVLGFLFSCIGGIVGIIAIVNADKANKAYAMGNETEGDSANSSARVLTIIALVLVGIGIIGTVGLVSIGFFNL